jgi:hypothetical protein
MIGYLLSKQEQGDKYAAGIPKLPRINPGTIVNNPRSNNLIPMSRRQELTSLPQTELWDLEKSMMLISKRFIAKV